MNILRRLLDWLSGLVGEKPIRLRYVDGDELPAELPPGDLVVAREGQTLWAAGLRCPCGCGRRLELLLLEDVKPRWSLSISRSGRPSLHPSVWVNDGCRAHFWLRDGRVHWC